MKMTMLYVHGEDIGYARAGTNIANRLRERRVTVYDDDGYKDDKLSSAKLRDHEYLRPEGEPPTNLMTLISVPTHLHGWYKGQYRSILTMWEAMRLPESFREMLHHLDMILVPSRHNQELFGQFHDNVQYIPLGISKDWQYRPPKSPYPVFRFLTSGRGHRKGAGVDPIEKAGDRKGVDLTYKAFRTVFPTGDPLKPGMPVPQLVLKSVRGNDGLYYGPGIKNVTGKLTAEEELDLYENSHCYVQPSRGEGFGLQPLQAIAMGRPTILTNAHGHASFAHLGIGLDWKPTPAGYFIYGDAGDWWEPDFEQLCEAMYDIYMNYEDYNTQAKINSTVATETFTWDKTVDRFMELLGPQMGDYSGDLTWERGQQKVYRITVRREWYGEIGGRSVKFIPDHEYWDFADVKRILFDAGILSSECINDLDSGLAPVQLAQKEDYAAHDAYCEHCGQMYNSGIKKSDLLYTEMMRNG